MRFGEPTQTSRGDFPRVCFIFCTNSYKYIVRRPSNHRHASWRARLSDTIPDGFTQPKLFDPLIHQVLESRYRIDEEVGRGGMGVVYRGTDLTLSRPVAIKTIIHKESNEESLSRFINEARTLAQIETPRLVPVYAVGQDEGYHYIVMKFLEGEDLSELMKREGALSVDRVLDITTQVCEALTALHERGIVHRDIKPANLMISPDGKVTVMDLGIAKGMGETPTSSAMGTPKYMPPEAIDNKPLDARADLYSLAVIAYQALVGRVPFDGPTPMAILYMQAHQPPPAIRELAPHVPRAVELFIEKALKKDPADRFQSAVEMAKALRTQEAQATGSRRGLGGYLIAAVALGALAWVLLQPPQRPATVNTSTQLNSPKARTLQAAVLKTGAPNTGQATTPVSLQNAKGITQGVTATQGTTQGATQGTTARTATAEGSAPSKATSAPKGKRRVKPRDKRVRVRVSSKPSGATIYYKGKRIGKTPETIEKPESESWPIQVRLKGFKSKHRTLKSSDVRVKLESLFGGF